MKLAFPITIFIPILFKKTYFYSFTVARFIFWNFQPNTGVPWVINDLTWKSDFMQILPYTFKALFKVIIINILQHSIITEYNIHPITTIMASLWAHSGIKILKIRSSEIHTLTL